MFRFISPEIESSLCNVYVCPLYHNILPRAIIPNIYLILQLRFPFQRCSVRFYSHLFCRGLCLSMFLYLFKCTGVQHDFHVTWCSYHLTVTWRVPLVEQKMSTLPGHICQMPKLNNRVHYTSIWFIENCVCCLTIAILWLTYNLLQFTST